MTDDRNDASNGADTDDIGQSEQLSNPPPAAAPPPLADPSPPSLAAGPQPPAPARPVPWAAIIAVVLGVILIVLVILWFTGVLDRSPRNSSEEGTSTSGTGSGALGALGGDGSGGRSAGTQPLETIPPAAAPPSTTPPGTISGYAPTVSWLLGTWGPGCPQSRAQSVTLYSGGRMVAAGGEGSWTLDGYNVTLVGNGRSLMLRWEYMGQDISRVTQIGTGDVETLRRCY